MAWITLHWNFNYDLLKENECGGMLMGQNHNQLMPRKLSNGKLMMFASGVGYLALTNPTLLWTIPYQMAAAMWEYLKGYTIKKILHNSFSLSMNRGYIVRVTSLFKNITWIYESVGRIWISYWCNCSQGVPCSHLENSCHKSTRSVSNENPTGIWVSPNLDIRMQELRREELRCQSQATLEWQKHTSGLLVVAYTVQGRLRPRDMSKTKCY